MVGTCLRALGVTGSTVSMLPEGPGWAFAFRAVAVYVVIDTAAHEIAIEVPLVYLTVHQHVPMLRTMLELNASLESLGRLCLREDVVLPRFADDLENVPPPKLVRAVVQCATTANDLATLFETSFSARNIGRLAQARDGGVPLAWKHRGTRRRLDLAALAATAPDVR